MPNVKLSAIALDEARQGHSPKKFKCPQCNHKSFVRYFNYETNEYLPDDFGRCDREENCIYFNQPYEVLRQAQDYISPIRTNKNWKPHHHQPENNLKVVEKSTMRATLQMYDYNILIAWLISIVGRAHVDTALCRYFIGTAKNGATLFWLVDAQLRVRGCKKMLYLPDGHRNKLNPAISLFTIQDGYKPCLFGEHLLFTEGNADCIVAIVESEKTAIICSIYMPSFAGKKILWLASSGSNGLTDEKIIPLANREVFLCPDMSYHARATWGALPMRKDHITKKPDPAGELALDYTPAAKRLENIGCTVKFYDPFPHITDSSDLADIFIKYPVPTILTQPNRKNYILPDTQTIETAQSQPQQDTIRTPDVHSYPLRPVSFKITTVSDTLKVSGDQQQYHTQIEAFVNSNENLVHLIRELQLFTGQYEHYE